MYLYPIQGYVANLVSEVLDLVSVKAMESELAKKWEPWKRFTLISTYTYTLLTHQIKPNPKEAFLFK